MHIMSAWISEMLFVEVLGMDNVFVELWLSLHLRRLPRERGRSGPDHFEPSFRRDNWQGGRDHKVENSTHYDAWQQSWQQCCCWWWWVHQATAQACIETWKEGKEHGQERQKVKEGEKREQGVEEKEQAGKKYGWFEASRTVDIEGLPPFRTRTRKS